MIRLGDGKLGTKNIKATKSNECVLKAICFKIEPKGLGK
jgi:hypothetical protein